VVSAAGNTLGIATEDVDARLRLPGAAVLLGVDQLWTPEPETEIFEVLPVGRRWVVLLSLHDVITPESSILSGVRTTEMPMIRRGNASLA
jgi:hypothetical protein